MIQTNFWSRFLDLLPKAPRLLGDIATNTGNGNYVVTLLGGGTLNCRAVDITMQPGTRVFIKEGVIEGKAPALTAVMVELP